jgi:hypothetical protein
VEWLWRDGAYDIVDFVFDLVARLNCRDRHADVPIRVAFPFGIVNRRW